MPEWLHKVWGQLTGPGREANASPPSGAAREAGTGMALLAPISTMRDQFTAAIVLVLGIALSVTVFLGTHHYFRLGERQEFERQAAHYAQTVVNATQRYEQFVHDLALRFEGSTPMDRWQFDDYSQDLLERHSGLLSLAWIPYVQSDRRGEFEANAHDDGLLGFRIREPRDDAGRPAGIKPREFYFPIYYAVPFDLDREYLGIDLYSLVEFKSALDAAGEGGHPVVLPWSRFGSLTGKPTELQILRPVYDSRESGDIGAPKKQRLLGFVAGALQLERIVETVIKDLTTPAWLDIYIYRQHKGADGSRLLFLPSRMRNGVTEPLGTGEVMQGLFSRYPFTIGDLELSVVVKPVAAKYSFESSILPYWAGSFGLLLTFFIAYSLAAAQSRTRVIERTVAERTTALSDANISLHNEILERQRAEMEMRRAKDEAEVANRAKSEFLAMVSHELRTPLNAIIGFSEIMSQEVFGPVGNKKYTEYVSDIRKSGTHLLGLINNILDLSKVESGQFRLNDDKIRLGDGISEVMRFVSELAEMDGVKVVSAIPSDLPALRGDQQAIRQILLNLLSNAIKFTEQNGHVLIGAQLDQAGRLVLAVRDTGIGIPEDSLEAVFEPFTQVDSSLARKFEGTGLGLPLTRSLVELHGGSVDLDSKLGEGTTVTVTFPRERVVGATAC